MEKKDGKLKGKKHSMDGWKKLKKQYEKGKTAKMMRGQMKAIKEKEEKNKGID